MSGLVGYGSSDDEEEDVGKVVDVDQQPKPSEDSLLSSTAALQLPSKNGAGPASKSSRTQIPTTVHAPASEPLPGPSLGPSPAPATDTDIDLPNRAQSPHTAYQEVIQNLTLPTVPNFDIPPSPPGSPPPGVDAKIQQFLKLKKQGIHFNEKLASSSALKNPSLLGKLIANAGLSDEQQYANTLPAKHWHPAGFQDWMFKENLEKARQAADKIRGESVDSRARKGIEFVHGQSE